tara:strand:+ start:81765 stop:82352 length:588 start_codon:yes stop_codon:yes gene_type:complete
MEILYTAIEEKQAELEESLITVQHQQEHIKQSFERQGQNCHNITQSDQACIRLEELSLQQQGIQEELDILSDISSANDAFEDVRLAARAAHTCILKSDSFGTYLSAEEGKLSRLADRSEMTYQDFIIEYKRIKKSPPEGISQEELLQLYMGYERKIAAERVKRDLFTIMAERLLYEYNICKSEDILHPEVDGLSI